ncbi:hypothetical protein AAVH_28375, partial [Aphelenchoides avenae]
MDDRNNRSWMSRIYGRLERIPRDVRHVLFGFVAAATIVFIVFGIVYVLEALSGSSPPDPCGGAYRAGDNCYTA